MAKSDWWASRMVVSVISTCCCASIQSRKPSGPCSSSNCLVPEVTGCVGSKVGTTGAIALLEGMGRPATSGLPLTVTSAM